MKLPTTIASDVSSGNNGGSGNARRTFSVHFQGQRTSEIRAAVSAGYWFHTQIRGNRGSIASVHTKSTPVLDRRNHRRLTRRAGHIARRMKRFISNGCLYGGSPATMGQLLSQFTRPEVLVELRGYSTSNITARETRSVNEPSLGQIISFHRQYGGEIVWDYLDRKTGSKGRARYGSMFKPMPTAMATAFRGNWRIMTTTDYLAGGVWLYAPQTVRPMHQF